MPAFVTNGPDIPERLLQLHEEGKVVFFCGAGISYPAGLPGFGGLIRAIYDELGTSPNEVQQAAIKAGQYDTAIGLLEADIVGGREKVRGKIAKILTPTDTGGKVPATHDALLTLGRNRDGQMRLITTNFDRIFEEVIVHRSLDIERFKAPLLPIPKNRWDGLVYLHGLLSVADKISELDRLVVSSGDFGLAYLTERWAARFVSELFRNYTVCFVGYSINDPVLRYMMDALAADKLLGESPPEMFAFGSYSKGKQEKAAQEWQAKNVTPILYKMHSNHYYLHRTLRKWAESYHVGARGKEMIIAEHAGNPPLGPSCSDYAVGRMLWALTDELAAKHFADLPLAPPLEWLKPLSEDQFEHRDLSRFRVVANTKVDNELRFSMIFRPTPYTHSPRMSLFNLGGRGSKWDEVMSQLARWLMRHLDDPKLIIWLAKNGDQLHEDFAKMIRNRLAESPKGIPGPHMRTLWRLFLAGRVKTHASHTNLFDWLTKIKQDGVTPLLRMELREILKPCVILRAPYGRKKETPGHAEPKHIRDLIDWKLVLNSESVHTILHPVIGTPHWQAALADLLPDFALLLRDAMDLKHELGGAEEKTDLTYVDQPSISEHPQNRDSRDWTALIELTRDAWLATLKTDPIKARHTAKGWWRAPYPIFKRLALFAAAQDNVISNRRALDWLLDEKGWWLWSGGTQREAIRLLVTLAPKLDTSEMGELEQALLAGPPLEMYKDGLEEEDRKIDIDNKLWLRLAKIENTGVELSRTAKNKLNELRDQYSGWKLSDDCREEFPFWMESGWVGDRDPWRTFVSIPRRRRDLLNYLLERPELAASEWDKWKERCRESFQTTAYALYALTKKKLWPEDRWRKALQVWAEDKHIQRSWRYMGPVLNDASDEFIHSLAHNISWWIKAIAKTFEDHETIFLDLCRRILKLPHEDGVYTDDPVSRAINHPVGHVTQALVHWWYRRPLKDGGKLTEEIKTIFTDLCDTENDNFRHGRVILAAQVVALYRVDPEWTRNHLLPLFDWQSSTLEAPSVWEGFLWSPRLYRPLISAIKVPLLEAASHYDDLGDHAEQYAAFLTFAALDPGDTFTNAELVKATSNLPMAGLEKATQTLTHALESARDQREEYWRNRVQPYLRRIWPKSNQLITITISENMGRLCIAADKVFQEALQQVRHWLQRLQRPNFLIQLIHKADLCKPFPGDALTFLDAVVGDDARWLPKELQLCLNDIEESNEQLREDIRFIRLSDLAKRHGIT